ncbi:helicase MPH1 [Seminavis robusta]|uniref:Helicase MPH1 n=1 Tax=Seminavis robusta TaxID=568900 RepID=A0A9N8DJ11_9STRA|nr:helicase MPH1 [Seminavis robusta]|eukprot:Sro111_g055380.1 helicase MPH1 (1947) ;mRNA; f:81508-87444
MPSAKKGWSCSKCTFEHQFPGDRCVMCGSLRTTKEQMIDFIQGKPIPESSKINCSSTSTTSAPTNKKRKPESPQAKPPPKPQQPPSTATAYFAPKPKGSSTGTAAASSNTDRTNGPAANHNSTSSNSGSNLPQSSHTRRRNPYSKNPSRASVSTDQPSANTNANSHPTNGNPHPNNHDRSEEQESTNHNSSNSLQQNQQQPSLNAHAYKENQQSNARQTSFLKPPPKQSTSNQRTAVTTASTKQSVARSNNSSNNTRKQQQTLLPMPKKTTSYAKYIQPRIAPYEPGPVPFDTSTTSTWVYPIHPKYAKRDYQFEMAKSGVLEDTLICLPTGLGKTLVGAVVMYNFYRWFPQGKLVFCAPTLPLVQQQAKAVYDIVGIPMSETAVLTGRVKSEERAALWQTHRLFFCTPQTIENDMRNQVIDASSVVCVLLDEVHKARGDHAYVQVIQLLRTQAKAKFRLVGLSATPGSTIEVVQDVIQTLQVSKIEVRSDDDPSIQQYTHNRVHEVIEVAETALVTKTKDVLLNLIRAPLKRLQQAGFLKSSGSGATISTYSVLQEQQKYYEGLSKGDRRCPGKLRADFLLVHKLIGWRDSVGVYGIHRFRSNVAECRNDPRAAFTLAAVFGDKDFQEHMEDFKEACKKSKTDDSKVQDMLAENPKLQKLQEVLNEHFERARARASREGGEVSTRAIVFSQLRGSVQDIVASLSALQPLVRPRRFVGQGKGSSKGKDAKEGVAVAAKDEEDQKGMNQTEQHKVLAEFRSGIHNVLVCTSIGEEGLDIGEVDLIVNFDCLSSPIRMLQRVGRTGRARDGRVVSILSKGEEQKHKRSKAREKTLIRALKDPTKMKFFPKVPMFPPNQPLPTLIEKRLRREDDLEFRQSQVDGMPRKRKPRGSLGSASGSKRSRGERNNTDWKLTDGEEMLRRDLFGDDVVKCCESDATSGYGFPAALRKRFLKARTYSYSAQTQLDMSRYPLGSTLTIARKMQMDHGTCYDVRRPVSRSFLRDEEEIQQLFPVEKGTAESCSSLTKLRESKSNIEHVKRPTTEARQQIASSDRVGQRRSLPPTSNAKVSNTGNVMERNAHIARVDESVRGKQQGIASTAERRAIPGSKPDDNRHASNSSTATAVRENMPAPAARPKPVSRGAVNPYRKARSASTEPKIQRQGDLSTHDPLSLPNREHSIPSLDKAKGSASVSRDQNAPVVGGMTATVKSTMAELHVGQSESAGLGKSTEAPTWEAANEPDTNDVDINDGFYLPTPPDSSSSESDGSVGDDASCQQETKDQPKENRTEESSAPPMKVVIENLPTELNSDKASHQVKPAPHNQDDGSFHLASQSFRLPTQSSSSSSSSSSLEDESQGKAKCNDGKHPDVTAHIPSDAKDQLGDEIHQADPSEAESPPKMQDEGNATTPGNRSPAESLEVSEEADSEVPNFKRRKPLKAKRDMFLTQVKPRSESPKPETPAIEAGSSTLVDTPDQLLDTPETAMKVQKTKQAELIDTPTPNCVHDRGAEVVCVLCLDPKSPDEDPILLCDGPDCNLAVHLKCYNIHPSVLEDDEDTPWFCDPCKFLQEVRRGATITSVREQGIKCLFCQQGKGPLKKTTPRIWSHPYCENWSKMLVQGDDTVCAICSGRNAAPCAKEGCSVAVHPHCAITSIMNGSGSWTLVRAKSDPSNDSAAEEAVGEQNDNALSVLFCPSDKQEASRFASSLREAANQIVVIPPDSLEIAAKGHKSKLRRLKRHAPSKESAQDESEVEVVDVDAQDKNTTVDKDDDAIRDRKRARMERRNAARRFIDEEAGIDSDEGHDGDDAEQRELAALEAEENSLSSFINDSSQLGFTQDQLGRIEPDSGATNESSFPYESDALHRRLDNENARRNEFATPFLNRRMQRDSLSPSDAPSSERGLGNMHFVRSVIEYQRQGGSAQEVEDLYNRLEQEASTQLGQDESPQPAQEED